MAAVQTTNQKPDKPPKLANTHNICYCNALFQCLFNIDDIWNEVQRINENDPFKKIAKSFLSMKISYRILMSLYLDIHTMTQASSSQTLRLYKKVCLIESKRLAVNSIMHLLYYA